jgi:hypothetical protein
MIAIGKEKQETKKAEPKPSFSQQNQVRKAAAKNAKKMTAEKAQRLKRAGIAE